MLHPPSKKEEIAPTKLGPKFRIKLTDFLFVFVFCFEREKRKDGKLCRLFKFRYFVGLDQKPFLRKLRAGLLFLRPHDVRKSKVAATFKSLQFL